MTKLTSLNNLISIDNIPAEFEFIQDGINTVFSKLFF